ncbi:MAG: hypothetical protein GF355_04025 [Candidatus Eisenbacteria bacterium]|nr:hypothetical protein [Candidatus Eisenbacteria bacterium]
MRHFGKMTAGALALAAFGVCGCAQHPPCPIIPAQLELAEARMEKAHEERREASEDISRLRNNVERLENSVNELEKEKALLEEMVRGDEEAAE